MAANNMNNLTTLIKRLEAATSRLEDIASSTFPADGSAPPPDAATEKTVATGASAQAPPPPPAKLAESLPPAVAAYDALLESDLKTFISLSKQIGGVIAEQAENVSSAFVAQRQFILLATKAKKPDMSSAAFGETLKDTTQAMIKLDEAKQSCRDKDLKNHLSLLADGVGALGWVTMQTSPKPFEYVTELFGGAQMYGNNVLKTFKDKDKTQVEWVQSYYKLFKSLSAYAREYHLSGVQWNPNGIDAMEALRQLKEGSATSAPAPPAGGAPPPPPPPGPPPPPVIAAAPQAPKPGAGDMGAVFSQLNQGADVTKGLKKVDASQMTHKNPSLRAQAPVPERKESSGSINRDRSPLPGKKPKPESLRTKKPPKKELDGNKWLIENYENPPTPIEINVELNHSILISRCKNTTLRIYGKANAITIDNSSRFSIIVESLVSSVDVIKSPNFALQVLGSIPTILLDQVDAAQIYLSHDSLNTEVFSSKSTGINVILPPPEDDEEDADYTECPIPEQIRSYVKDGKLISEIVEHTG